jgi:heme exporter protein B
MPAAPSCSIATVTAVFLKDWRSEWRTRAGLNSSVLFALAAPIALSFSVARQNLAPETLAGLLWTVLLFAALVGLSRVFIKEEESGTAALLRLSYPADAVLWGKALFNFTLLAVAQIAAVPVFIVLLNVHIAQPALLALTLIGGDLGLAAATALLGAVASQARARGALFAAISIPVLLPLLVAASAATAATLGAGSGVASAPPEFWPPFQVVACYDVAMAIAGWMLFDYVWS